MKNNDAQNNVVVNGLSLKVNETSADVYNDGVLLQTLKFPQGMGTPFSFEYAKEHYGFLDMNFDGEYDVYIAVADVDGIIYYYCWLYNATAKEFQYSPALSDLKNISVDGADYQSRFFSWNENSFLVFLQTSGHLRGSKRKITSSSVSLRRTWNGSGYGLQRPVHRVYHE